MSFTWFRRLLEDGAVWADIFKQIYLGETGRQMDAGKGLGPDKAFEVTGQISPFWSKNKALNKE
ncbi:Hypothetical protein FKW44_008572, partial [Caligus rogercresseyi]